MIGRARLVREEGLVVTLFEGALIDWLAFYSRVDFVPGDKLAGSRGGWR